MKKKILICVFAATVVIAVSITLFLILRVSNADGPKVGTYYCDTSDGECLLVIDGRSFEMSLNGVTGLGKVVANSNSIELKFDDGSTLEGSYDDRSVTIIWDGYSLEFLPKIEYTVSFCSDGKTVDFYVVVNGRMLNSLPEPDERQGYLFTGWFTSDGVKLIAHETRIFGDVTAYAAWVKGSKIIYDYGSECSGVTGEDGEPITGAYVAFGQRYKLVEPLADDAAFAFVGWYDPDGTRYTDERGEGLSTWAGSGDMILYARWVRALEFELIEDRYFVSAAESARELSVLRVPDLYNGITVGGIVDFSVCKNLEVVYLPESLSIVYDRAFSDCEKLQNIYVGNGGIYFDSDGVLFCDADGTVLICYPRGRTGEIYKVPEYVVEIGSYAFYKCRLAEVEMGAATRSVGDHAFAECKLLTAVKFGNGIMSIGAFAFSSSALTSVTLPPSLSELKQSTFEGCEFLETVEFSEGLKIIGRRAFCGTKIHSIILPISVTEVQEYAFYGSAIATLVCLEGSLLEIVEDYAFASCPNLRFVDLSPCGALTYLGNSAFETLTLEQFLLPKQFSL